MRFCLILVVCTSMYNLFTIAALAETAPKRNSKRATTSGVAALTAGLATTATGAMLCDQFVDRQNHLMFTANALTNGEVDGAALVVARLSNYDTTGLRSEMTALMNSALNERETDLRRLIRAEDEKLNGSYRNSRTKADMEKLKALPQVKALDAELKEIERLRSIVAAAGDDLKGFGSALSQVSGYFGFDDATLPEYDSKKLTVSARKLLGANTAFNRLEVSILTAAPQSATDGSFGKTLKAFADGIVAAQDNPDFDFNPSRRNSSTEAIARVLSAVEGVRTGPPIADGKDFFSQTLVHVKNDLKINPSDDVVARMLRVRAVQAGSGAKVAAGVGIVGLISSGWVIAEGVKSRCSTPAPDNVRPRQGDGGNQRSKQVP